MDSDRFVSHGEKPQSNFRCVAVKSLADKVMSLIHNLHDRAPLDFVRGHHVAAIDPKMAVANSFGSARGNDDPLHVGELITVRRAIRSQHGFDRLH